MEQHKSTLTILRSLRSKWKKKDETFQNCNTEFDFVNFDTCTMWSSIQLEEVQNRGEDNVEKRNIFGDTEQTLSGSLWQIPDTFLSRWKEQFCVLTKNSLYSFRRGFGGRKVSKIQLADVCDVKILREKGQLTLCLEINKTRRMMFRTEDGIRVWYERILANMDTLRQNNYRRCFSAEYHRKRPRMGISSLTFAI